MRKLVTLINVSVDGYADHTMPVVVDSELHEFVTDYLESADIALFGRVTYKLFEDYWPTAAAVPYATKGEILFAEKINKMHKIVFSKTLEKTNWENVELIKGDAVSEIKKLKQMPGKNLSVGGLNILQSLIRQDMVDEYWLLVHPIVVNKGHRLFDNLDKQVNLKLLDSQVLKSGVAVLHYERINN